MTNNTKIQEQTRGIFIIIGRLQWNGNAIRYLSSLASHTILNYYGDHDDVDDEGDGQVSLSYLPEHAAILLSVLTYAPIILPDNLFRPTVTLPLLLHTFTLF